MLEEFVSGTEHSFDSIVINGKPVWHSISRYMPAPLQVLENPWIQWCVFLPKDISGEEFAPIRDAGFKAVEALGLQTGLSHMEWFRLAGRPYRDIRSGCTATRCADHQSFILGA